MPWVLRLFLLPDRVRRRAAFAAACGAAVLGSFVLEVQGFRQAGYTLCAVAVLVYFFCEVPVHQAGWGGGSLALGLRIALFSIPLRSVLVLSALVALAMLTRVAADWIPRVTMSHYADAAIAWSLGVTIWVAAILPSVRKMDTPSRES